jgi:hypothetical protein
MEADWVRYVLVPLGDCLNHAPGAPVTFDYDGEEAFLLVQRCVGPDCVTPRGQEVFLDYRWDYRSIRALN